MTHPISKTLPDMRAHAHLIKVFQNPRTRAVVWWGIALGVVIGCYLIPISGYDWFMYWRSQALNTNRSQILNPMWIYLLLKPIALLPARLDFLAFGLMNVGQIWLAARSSRVNRFALLLSFPALWLLWYGQLDGFVMLGAALGLWAVESNKPLLTGLAAVLLLVKPQVGAPLALVYLLWQRNWKALIIPAGLTLASMVLWGWDWPLIWVRNLLVAGSPKIYQHPSNIGLFPYGLAAWLGIFVPMRRERRALFILAATITSVPYVGTYSLLSLLALRPPWWAFVLSSAPIMLGQGGYRITALAAPLVVIWSVMPWIRNRWPEIDQRLALVEGSLERVWERVRRQMTRG